MRLSPDQVDSIKLVYVNKLQDVLYEMPSGGTVGYYLCQSSGRGFPSIQSQDYFEAGVDPF